MLCHAVLYSVVFYVGLIVSLCCIIFFYAFLHVSACVANKLLHNLYVISFDISVRLFVNSTP